MILIIDNYDSFTYNLVQMVKTTYNNVVVCRNDKVDIESIQKMMPKAIIISPGPGHPETAGCCIDVIKQFSGIIPILGICLGHQAIVCAFGGSLDKTEFIVHGKSDLIYHDGKNVFSGCAFNVVGGRYHSLQANKQSLPNSLKVSATNGSGIIMGVTHVAHPTFGLQFHPESILTENGEKIINNFIRMACYEEVLI